MAASNAALLSTYLAVTALLVLTPGVGTTFLLSTVLADGRRAAYLTAVGMIVGSATHATVAALAATALLRAAPSAIGWIGVIGGGLIVGVGVLALYRAAATRGAIDTAPGKRVSAHGRMTTGALISLANAPLPLFYLVVVPQYVPHGMSRLAGVSLLSLIHLVMAFTWMLTFITLVGRIIGVFRQPRVRLWLQCASGVLLVALGVQAMFAAI